ncbi:MAG: AAA family ATPase [Prevotellaceae bacterium]|nr:AAA family ATPase [Prevotellaceae bacterium]
MNDFIKYVEIRNFKSIRHLKIDGCRRINLLIGCPNAGKSNIIEALGLFSSPFLEKDDDLHKLVRFECEQELFYKSMANEFTVETNLHKICARVPNICDNISAWDWNSNVLKYKFCGNTQWKSAGNPLLLPPFGENIMDTLSFNQNADEIKKWIKKELNGAKLELVFDRTSGCMKIQGRPSENEVFTLPYSSIADTLQRIIFYKTAIASNKDSVLLFEEPEAHAFPPYVRMFAYDIAASKSNQFFIATHSPVIVGEFIEDEEICRELSIYIVGFKNSQTTAKRLTDDDLNDIFERGIDLFFELERYC